MPKISAITILKLASLGIIATGSIVIPTIIVKKISNDTDPDEIPEETQDNDPTHKEYKEFIADRSFSLSYKQPIGNGYMSTSSGTAWIFKRAKKDSNDYIYHMMTNYHVYEGYKSLYESYPLLQNKGHFSLAFEGLKYTNQYYSYDYVDLEDQRFTDVKWYDPIKIGPIEQGVQPYADVVFFSFDLKPATEKDQTGKLKQRLDRLNNDFPGDNDDLIKFTKKQHEKGTQMFTAGFPWERADGADNKRSYSEFSFVSGFIDYNENNGKNIFLDENKKVDLITKQNQFFLERRWASFINGAGASGSLVINQEKEVVGLYWGGYLSDSYTHFTPGFLYLTYGNYHETGHEETLGYDRYFLKEYIDWYNH